MKEKGRTKGLKDQASDASIKIKSVEKKTKREKFCLFFLKVWHFLPLNHDGFYGLFLRLTLVVRASHVSHIRHSVNRAVKQTALVTACRKLHTHVLPLKLS